MRTITLLTAIVAVVLATVFASSPLSVRADGTTAADFSCPLCQRFAWAVAAEGQTPRKACAGLASALLPAEDTCAVLLTRDNVRAVFGLRGKFRSPSQGEAPRRAEIREMCAATALCPRVGGEMAGFRAAGAAGWNMRISPAMGMRGAAATDLVRVTLVNDNAKAAPYNASVTAWFDYNAPVKFLDKHSWVNKTIHTTLAKINASAGGIQTLDIGGGAVKIPLKVARPGQGIRAVFIGDPCFSSEWVGCKWGKAWKVLPRMAELFNTLAEQKDALHVYGLLGDNFYDAGGDLAQQFYTQLNGRALGTMSINVAGNHDYWEHGSPIAPGYDTRGNGYIQLYAQDTVAAVQGGPSMPFDFSVDPHKFPWRVAAVENVVSWSMVGNTAFITSSGANTIEETKKYLVQACEWVGRVKPKVVFAINHWSEPNCGCQPNMTSLEVRDLLVTLPGCKEMASRVLELEGHSHFNIIVRPDVAFRFGGAGMSSHHGADFGIPFIDTYHDKVEIWYFPIARQTAPASNGDAEWAALMDCVKAKGGLHQCTHLAKKFASLPL